FFFLDDDDILYPFYSARLTELVDLTGSDLGFAVANSSIPSKVAQAGHQPMPASVLLVMNFIPIHCYIVRTAFLLATDVRVQEDMDYLEDWDFLLALFAAGARFSSLPEVICEYRIIGDGNRRQKRFPEQFEKCKSRVLKKGRATAFRAGLDRFV